MESGYRREKRQWLGPSALAILIATSALAGPFTSGNIVVVRDDTGGGTDSLREYDLSGNLVQTIDLPPPTGTSDFGAALCPRDLVVDANGKGQIYYGTFDPRLTTFNPSAGTYAYTSFPPWSTISNISYGGITAWDGFVYAPDMDTATGPANGIVRFDVNTVQGQRFFQTPPEGISEFQNFRDVTCGLDGKLYAFAVWGGLEVIVPTTMTLIKEEYNGDQRGGRRQQ